MVVNTMEALLADGFTSRMAEEYLETLAREDASGMFDAELLEWAHSRGFFAESACAFHLSDDNVADYLSDYDYFRVWPLNSWERIWINDKLTLKYLLADGAFSRYLPRYYYYASPSGLVPLLDCEADGSFEGFLSTLREVGEFACKPCNGECSAGFNKLSYSGGTYLVNNVPSTEEGVRTFVEAHANDIFTEFFHPGGALAEISPVIHTLRVQTVNPTGTDPVIAASYLRFATDVDGDDSKANYRPPEEEGVCSFNVRFDVETGEFGDGCLVFGNRVVHAPCHPDTGVEAVGRIECWPELREMILGIARRFNLLEYMGFDVCVTPDGPRLIEINSHSGGKYLQLFRPFMADAYLGRYFRDRLSAVDELDDGARARRNATRR